jgi:hypothetical protein
VSGLKKSLLKGKRFLAEHFLQIRTTCYFHFELFSFSFGKNLDNINYTDKKENRIFLIYREILSGAVAKSYMRKGFLIYGEMRKYFPIYEEAVSHT